MKVILLRDVAKIGKRFEIKEVPDGYALNKLIPKKDAEAATPVNVKRIQERNKKDLASNDLAREKAGVISEACSKEPLIIEMEANEQGHLFQGVRASDVVNSAKARQLSLSETQLQFASPVKSLGMSEVFLIVGSEKFTVPLNVVAKEK